jgi:hypothetical protein
MATRTRGHGIPTLCSLLLFRHRRTNGKDLDVSLLMFGCDLPLLLRCTALKNCKQVSSEYFDLL